jgi:hypothetical protein
MTTKELIDKLRRMPPDSVVFFQVEDQCSGPADVIWDGESVVLWDGDHLYPVETDPDSGIVPGAEVKSDPPCEYDYALVSRKTVLGREYGVIEQAWDA